VGIDPDAARIGDIAVEVAHSGFYTRAKVWLKVSDGARGWVSILEYKHSTTTPRTLRKVTPLFAERQSGVPRLGDIWVPKSAVSPNYFTRFYIPGVEDLFQIGDHLVRVEHGGSRSRVISWRIWRKAKRWAILKTCVIQGEM